MTRASTVLILSRDTVAAALLGLAAEQAGFAPAFAEAGERPEEALARVRPLFVVLVEADLEAARSDVFFALAARRRVGLAILRRPGSESPLAAWAVERDVPVFRMPTDVDQFARVVEAASASAWWRSGRDRRRSPRTERAADGTLVYVDRAGARWQVYDRRAGERRRPTGDERSAPAKHGAGLPERIFVGAGGMAWCCALGADEDTDAHGAPTPHQLEQQLARATRVPHS